MNQSEHHESLAQICTVGTRVGWDQAVTRRIATVVATTLALVALSVPTAPSAAAATTTIPAGTQLRVQGATPASEAVFFRLARVKVSTSTPNETRMLRAYLSVQHARSGTANLPDRFYFVASASCAGGADRPEISAVRNLLAKGSITLSPQLLVTFPHAGTHTCLIKYKLSTSRSYNDSTDDVVVRTGGYITITDPLPTWAEQCYWPVALSGTPADCELASEVGAASAAIELGTSLGRNPIRVSIPAGTTVQARGDAFLTTSGGTGGADSELSGKVGSFRPSTVRSVIDLVVVGSSDQGCWPTRSTIDSLDGRAWLDLPVKVHHGVLHNNLKFTTSMQAGCPTTYDLVNNLTVTSGETVITHQNGTILFLTGFELSSQW